MSGSKEYFNFNIDKIDSYIFEEGDLVKIHISNHEKVIEAVVVRAKAKCDRYKDHPLLKIVTENDYIGWKYTKTKLIGYEVHFAENDADIMEKEVMYYYLENSDIFEHFPQYNTKLGKLL